MSPSHHVDDRVALVFEDTGCTAYTYGQLDALAAYDLSSLRFMTWGATPVTASVAQTVTRRSGVPWVPRYRFFEEAEHGRAAVG